MARMHTNTCVILLFLFNASASTNYEQSRMEGFIHNLQVKCQVHQRLQIENTNYLDGEYSSIAEVCTELESKYWIFKWETYFSILVLLEFENVNKVDIDELSYYHFSF